MSRSLSSLIHPAGLLLALFVSATMVWFRAPHAVILVVVTCCSALAVALLERVMPYREAWRHDHRDTRTDVGLALLNLIVGALPGALLALLGVTLAAHGSEGALWREVPLVGQALIALIASDLLAYLAHRLVHRLPWLWRFHRLHHSAPRLYWLNSKRFHPLDALLIQSAALLPLLLTGLSAEALVITASVNTCHALLQHGNVALERGAAERLLSTSALHRWHHAAGPEHVNYGALLSVWDRLFGTAHDPDHDDTLPDRLGDA